MLCFASSFILCRDSEADFLCRTGILKYLLERTLFARADMERRHLKPEHRYLPLTNAGNIVREVVWNPIWEEFCSWLSPKLFELISDPTEDPGVVAFSMGFYSNISSLFPFHSFDLSVHQCTSLFCFAFFAASQIWRRTNGWRNTGKALCAPSWRHPHGPSGTRGSPTSPTE